MGLVCGIVLYISSTTVPLLTTFCFSGLVSLRLEPPPDINSLNFKKLYWYGYNDTSNDLSGTLCIVMDIFKYAIWKSKQRRHLPNILALSREISFILDVACTASRTFRLTTANINLISNLFSEAEHRHLHFSSSLLFMN